MASYAVCQGEISILAPARGATHGTICQAGPCRRFQFSPLREGRRNSHFPRRRQKISILAPARGATPNPIPDAAARLRFQFSPLREGRLQQFAPVRHDEISILAPARGATHNLPLKAWNYRDFNSRPCERGDICRKSDFRHRAYFNSRPCERGDGDAEYEPGFEWISILAPARGATITPVKICPRRGFQFSPLREGRHIPDFEVAGADPISILAPARGAT